MFFIKLVPDKTKVPFMGMHKIAMAISMVAIVASISIFFMRGLNFGIDFVGGTLIEIQTEGAADIGGIRSTLGGLGLGEIQVQEFGAPEEVLIRVQTQEVSASELTEDVNAQEKAQQAVVATVQKALRGMMADKVTFRRVEVVGPKVSGELVVKGITAIVSAIGLMLLYIWFRFEWQFSIGAVLALAHDIVLTIGLFALLQLDFNLSTIAALLLIVGYSMNDTVVVYDRIRENLRKYKRMNITELLDISINETLSRTTMTSVTTLLALLSLNIFGGEIIRSFTFAMIWGVLIGTYSSIFIASPLLLYTGVKRDWSGLGGKEAEKGLARSQS